MKSYRDLDIYNLSYSLALEVHDVTMNLPKYELFELGSQLRRSSKNIVFNIVEGNGRKRYKNDFIRFMIIAHASNDEVLSQIKMISDIYFKTEPLVELLDKYEKLSIQIHYFIKFLEERWIEK